MKKLITHPATWLLAISILTLTSCTKDTVSAPSNDYRTSSVNDDERPGKPPINVSSIYDKDHVVPGRINDDYNIVLGNAGHIEKNVQFPTKEMGGNEINRQKLLVGNWQTMQIYQTDVEESASLLPQASGELTNFNPDGSGYVSVINTRRGLVKRFSWSLENGQKNLRLSFDTDEVINYQIVSLTNNKMVLENHFSKNYFETKVYKRL